VCAERISPGSFDVTLTRPNAATEVVAANWVDDSNNPGLYTATLPAMNAAGQYGVAVSFEAQQLSSSFTLTVGPAAVSGAASTISPDGGISSLNPATLAMGNDSSGTRHQFILLLTAAVA